MLSGVANLFLCAFNLKLIAKFFVLYLCFSGISVTHRGEVLDLMPSRNASQMPGIQFISGLNNNTPAIYLTGR